MTPNVYIKLLGAGSARAHVSWCKYCNECCTTLLGAHTLEIAGEAVDKCGTRLERLINICRTPFGCETTVDAVQRMQLMAAEMDRSCAKVAIACLFWPDILQGP